LKDVNINIHVLVGFALAKRVPQQRGLKVLGALILYALFLYLAKRVPQQRGLKVSMHY